MRLARARRPVRRHLAAWAVLPALVMGTACDAGTTDSSAGETGAATESAGQEPDEPVVHDEESLLPAMKAAMGDASSFRMRMTMTGQASMSGEGRGVMGESFADTTMAMTIRVQGQRLEIRAVDGMIYMKGTPMAPEGAWLAVDPQDSSNAMAAELKDLVRSGSLSSTFDAFEAGLTGVQHLGEAEIDGETVQHYQLAVNTEEALGAMRSGGSSPPGMPEQLTYDMWLTEQNLMRRVSFELQGLTMVGDMTEWGEPVDVEAPAEENVVEQPQQAG